MKVLQVHNEYQFSGGEEAVLDAEHTMLKHYGHEVRQWVVSSSALKNANVLAKVGLSLKSIWSIDAYRQMRQQLNHFRADVVHVHNTIPLLTPSIYAACHDSGVAVVQTLHNYKLICPGSNLYRNERLCEDCVGKAFTYPALLHGCYRRDRLSTIFAVTGLSVNRLRGTYRNDIDVYIALTEFARQKMIEGGLPPDKVAVKPNFVNADIQVGSHQEDYALFAGRLIPQKGIKTLLQAWRSLDGTIPLKVVGRGMLESMLTTDVPKGVEYLGAVPRQEVLSLMQKAKLLIFPSEWYEGFPMTIVEAFATGLPVVASRLGSTAEIVRENQSGWLFQPGDANDLSRVVQRAWSNPTDLQQRGFLARKQYEEEYSIDKNYCATIGIYQKAIASIKPKV
ncbi:glycosyltransferase [Oculatella sp. LEGE 06141]|uniref:glycosyltransferase n=1 Tax=Oculatella sp. LEGE 06141 TaxID=1828648 RepID=UPI001882DFC4|nr:glycosyltransferase [Oculatella sp. LEGE 06141]MBE9179730.1 glycosyltransferase [Oculatella sp. LEGE 06141]